MADVDRCNRCGNLLPSDATEGICTACTLVAGLAPGSEPTTAAGSPGENVTFSFEPAQPGQVLESLARSMGTIPRVLLPDTAAGETELAITQPSSDEMPAPAERGGRYQLFGEIARGGMGAVIKGAIPTWAATWPSRSCSSATRTSPRCCAVVEEAQIGGQLQHPGIVPVYELGAFADRRPYFTMKLVKGRTLSALLKERQSPAHDLPRFLSVFEAICQTMAYAHARGVLHRDLKPSNVMVGSFGEVQVMDWGLAKVLKEGAGADESPAQPAPDESLVATVRNASSLGESQAGSVMGTPAYMAPEQATGDVERIGRRADVFGLGSILCEILTGEPTYAGRGTLEVLRTALRGETADALARLDGCGAEAELIALAKDCLAVEPADRPRDAGLVAGRITAYVAGVQERVQAAERERAVAVAKAIEERRRRKVQLALAASVLALTTLGGLSTTYYLQQRAARVAAGQRVIDQVTTLQAQALAQAEDIPRWEVALAAVEAADPAGDPNTKAQLVALQKTIEAGLDAARRDKALIGHLVDIRSAEGDDRDGSVTDHDYADAFREAGIDLASLPPAEAGAKIRARSPSAALALARALDDWAATRRGKRANAAGAARLSEAARVADPDPWRKELRTALDQADKAARLTGLQALAKTAKFEELGAISLNLLGTGLNAAGDSALAESVLRTAQQLHPRDVWINYNLGQVLERLSRRDEAIRFYTAARAIRPETAHELAHALGYRGDSDEAIAVFRDLKGLCPGNSRHLLCLALALKKKGLSREADETYEAAAVAAREAIRLKPDHAEAHFNLGAILCDVKHDFPAAEAEFRQAIRLEPDHGETHYNLGNALAGQGKRDEAIAEYRTAIRLQPDHAEAHCSLGYFLQQRGDYTEALEMFRKGHELGSPRPDWRYPSAQWVAEATRSLARAKRLSAMLRGDDKPADNAERVTFADGLRSQARHCRRPPVRRGAGERPEARRRPPDPTPLQRRLRRRAGRCRGGQRRSAAQRRGEGEAPRPGSRLAPRRAGATLEGARHRQRQGPRCSLRRCSSTGSRTRTWRACATPTVWPSCRRTSRRRGGQCGPMLLRSIAVLRHPIDDGPGRPPGPNRPRRPYRAPDPERAIIQIPIIRPRN